MKLLLFTIKVNQTLDIEPDNVMHFPSKSATSSKSLIIEPNKPLHYSFIFHKRTVTAVLSFVICSAFNIFQQYG